MAAVMRTSRRWATLVAAALSLVPVAASACAACSEEYSGEGWIYRGYGPYSPEYPFLTSGLWYHIWYCETDDCCYLHDGDDPDHGWYDFSEMPILGCPIAGFPSSEARTDGTNPGGANAATEEPANVINGALLDSSADIRAGALSFARDFSSARTNADSRVGLGWRDAFDWSFDGLATNAVSFLLNRPDGSSIQFLRYESEWRWRALRELPWTVLATNGIFRVETTPGRFLDFDAAGRWTAARDNAGAEAALIYDAAGRLASVTNNLGDRLDFSYGDSDRIVRIGTQRPSLFRTYAYDAAGRLTNSTLHASGESFATAYAYDEVGDCVAKTGPDDLAAHHAFDASHRVLAIEPGDGFFAHSIGYATNRWVVDGYDDWNPPFDWIDTSHWETVDHTVVSYRRDASTTNAFGYFFDSGKTRVSRIEGPDSDCIRTAFSENDKGLPTEELFTTTDYPWERVRTQWFYGSRMNLTQARFTYNATATARVEWNEDETLPVAIVDPAGFRTEFAWDAAGRLVETRDFPDEATTNATRRAYDAHGRLASVMDGDGRTVRLLYDGSNNPTSVIDAAGIALDLAWDDLGALVSSARRGSPATTRTVDDRGLVRGVVHPDGLAETFSYDALGRLTNAVDRAGRATALRPARYGLPAAVSRAGATVEADFDGCRDLRAVRDALGRTAAALVRDARGRVVAATNLEGQVATVVYGTGERPVSIRRFDGTNLSVSYDSLGRPSRVAAPGASTSFSWLANGLPAAVSNAAGAVRYAYDGRGAVTNALSPVGAVAYRATAAGIVTNVTGGGISVSAALDAAGRATNLVYAVPGLAPLSFALAYDPATGLPASLAAPNGVSAAFSNDLLDRPSSIAWSAGPSLAYAYSNDLVSAVVREDGSVREYGYDALDRLTSESAPGRAAAYAYDLAGNRLSKTTSAATVAYAYGAGDRLASWSAALSTNAVPLPLAGASSEPIGTDDRFGALHVRVGGGTNLVPHVAGTAFWTDPAPLALDTPTPVASAVRDAAGNTAAATNAVLPAAVTNAAYAFTAAGCVSNVLYAGTGGYSRNLAIGWDDWYRPVSFDVVETSVNSSLVTRHSSLTYDALGRILSVEGDCEAFTRLHDGGMPLADFDETGGLRRAYLTAPGVDAWLGFVDYGDPAAPALYTYCTDAQGSVLAVCDGTGAVVERYDYDAWGRILSIRDGAGAPLARSAVGNRIYWQGREYFPELGLYQFRARWYDPVTGRFLSKDPIGIAGGLNLYAFCAGDPVNCIDPEGTCSFSVCLDQLPGMGAWASKVLIQSSVVRNAYNHVVVPLGDIPELSSVRDGLKADYRLWTPRPVRDYLDYKRPLNNGVPRPAGHNHPGKTNVKANSIGKVFGRVGAGLAVASIGYEIYTIAEAPPDERPRTTSEAAGRIAGGAGGGWAGAAAGAAIGAPFGGIGAPIGATIGGFIGSFGGSWAGGVAGGEIYDAVAE